ncbi:hypothetical protein RSAG8_12065, partial [Rhizoctonia solani AG-8 WAC10335]
MILTITSNHSKRVDSQLRECAMYHSLSPRRVNVYSLITFTQAPLAAERLWNTAFHCAHSLLLLRSRTPVFVMRRSYVAPLAEMEHRWLSYHSSKTCSRSFS